MRLNMRAVLLGLGLNLFICNANAVELISTSARLYYPTMSTVDGNLHGNVTLVEFFDYRCSYCRQMPALLTELLQTHPNIRIVYRDYPMLGQDSLLAAQVALAAQSYAKYIDMHAALLTSSQPLNIGNIMQLGERAGLSAEQLKQGLASEMVTEQIQENISIAKSLGVIGIPTFIIARTPVLTEQQPVNAYLLVAPTLMELQTAITQMEKNA